MLQIIYIICIVATIILIIFRKRTGWVWTTISSFVGLAGAALSCVFVDNEIIRYILFFGWPIGLPLLLQYSNHMHDIYRVEENPNESISNNNKAMNQQEVHSAPHRNTTPPLRDEIFTCYASFLVSILMSCQYDRCGYSMKIKLEENFLLYFGYGKGCNSVPQNFPFQNFMQQTVSYMSFIGFENIIQQFKAMANEKEIEFCKTNLMNFATTCRIETTNQAPIQQATNICNAI